MSDSELVSKGPCPDCGSSDACALYDDGHTHCFSCGVTRKGDGEEPEEREPLRKDLLHGEVQPLPARKIDLKTAQKFDYRVGQMGGRKVQIAAYQDASGRTVAQKWRDSDKDFGWVGDPKAALPLFGQSKWRDGGRMVVVTEGELDAMSATQAMGGTWPAVSIPNGAQNAGKSIAAAASWLEQYDRVVFMFDMDDPGRKASEDAARLISPGKAFIAELPLKDANEMVKAGRSKELVDAAWNARQYRPDGIMSVGELKAKALAPPAYGLPFPFVGLTKATYGQRRGELYGWGAGVGSGKTTLFKQLMLTTMRPDLIEPHGDIPIIMPEPRKVGALLLEENPVKTLRTLGGMAIGKRVHVPGVEFDEAELAAAIDSFDGLFFPYNHFGAKDWDSIKNLIRYMVLALRIEDVFLDPLTALIAFADDDRKALDEIMADLASMVEQMNFTVHFISHLTTPTGTAHEEGGRVLEKHFTGSRAIARWSHNLFALERNKQEPDSPTILRILKERETGDATGTTLGLHYDRDTGRLIEVDLDKETAFGDETRTSDF